MISKILVSPTEKGFSATVLDLPGCAVEAATKDEAIEKAKAAAEALLARSDIVHVKINGEIGHNGAALQKSFAEMWANDETFDDFLVAMKAYREQLNAKEEEEIKKRCIGIFSDLDDETWNEFQTAIKEARAEIDAESNRL